MISYRTATDADVAYIAANLRAADRRELHAMCGLGADAALMCSFHASSMAVTALVDGVPAALFGVTPRSQLTGDGIPWLMGTDEMDRHPRAMLVQARQWLALVSLGYRRLANHVDARNARTIRWLTRLGFTIRPPEPFGPFGLAFHPFDKEI